MKFVSLMVVGFAGLMSVQGCAASVSTEEAEAQSTHDALSGACYTNSGLMPTKAALAVAMAKELGRWDPAHDLVSLMNVPAFPASQYNAVVQLSSTAKCTSNSCKNTIALLGLQDERLSTMGVVDQNVTSPYNLHYDLVAALKRSSDNLTNLKNNSPGQLPPAHKLTLVGGPTNLGLGACGPHYVFQADHLDGTALSTTEAQNLANDLVFFGYGDAGGHNPYIAYTITGQGCPTNRMCVALDPTDGDNGSGTTTTAGAAPTYPLNRLYDPALDKALTACVTTAGVAGHMQNKCSVLPTSCGYLYCMPGT
jgi:hypothetical protein